MSRQINSHYFQADEQYLNSDNRFERRPARAVAWTGDYSDTRRRVVVLQSDHPLASPETLVSWARQRLWEA